VLESIADTRIYEAADAALALGMMGKVVVDFLVCDKNLPDQDGLEVIRRARERRPEIDAMIVTGYPSPESAAEAIRMGATDYLLKPVREIKTLRASVQTALTRQKLQRAWNRHGAGWQQLVKELHVATAPGGRERAVLDEALEQFAMPLSPDEPAVAVLGEVEAQGTLRMGGARVVALKEPTDLTVLDDDVDLVLFGAEVAPEVARELLTVARGRRWTPHLLPMGAFTHTDTAVAAIEGRAGLLLDRPLKASDVRGQLIEAVARRRLQVRAEVLGRVLALIGCQY